MAMAMWRQNYLVQMSVMALMALPAMASSAELRPQARPSYVASLNSTAIRQVRADAAINAAAVNEAVSIALSRNNVAGIRPQLRPQNPALTDQLVQVQSVQGPSGFGNWVRGFRQRALRSGIRGNVFDAAFNGIRYNPEMIRLDNNQSEFVKPIWEYLDSAVSASRIQNGHQMLARYPTLLNRIEQRYGVDKEVVVAVWGLETSYGSFRGNTDVIEAMATLAYDGRRGVFFEEQLIAALRIIQSGDVSPRAMKGSWAGAMGHTQFMPTSYLSYAVDFNGDGKRNIWSDDPTDALASTAAYLARSGWKSGQPWGVEVRIASGFDYALANRETKRSPAQWARLGVVGLNGRPVPNYGRASILLPAGARGIALMIFDNFEAIERYNGADAYVIGVGHLSDRLKGRGSFVANWPRNDRPLSRSERRELQQRLTQAGFDTGGIDGRIGPNSINAIRRYQRARGILADGYASAALLRDLRR